MSDGRGNRDKHASYCRCGECNAWRRIVSLERDLADRNAEIERLTSALANIRNRTIVWQRDSDRQSELLRWIHGAAVAALSQPATPEPNDSEHRDARDRAR